MKKKTRPLSEWTPEEVKSVIEQSGVDLQIVSNDLAERAVYASRDRAEANEVLRGLEHLEKNRPPHPSRDPLNRK